MHSSLALPGGHPLEGLEARAEGEQQRFELLQVLQRRLQRRELRTQRGVPLQPVRGPRATSRGLQRSPAPGGVAFSRSKLLKFGLCNTWSWKDPSGSQLSTATSLRSAPMSKMSRARDGLRLEPQSCVLRKPGLSEQVKQRSRFSPLRHHCDQQPGRGVRVSVHKLCNPKRSERLEISNMFPSS